MEKKAGWICKHPQYGTWFISRQAVINDWKEDHRQYHGREGEPTKEDIESWFNEQTSWVEISAYGEQLERPDMVAYEKKLLDQMRQDTDWSEDITEVKGK